MDLAQFVSELLASEGYSVLFAPSTTITRQDKLTKIVVSPESITSSIKQTIGNSPAIWLARRTVNIIFWAENIKDASLRAKNIANILAKINDMPDVRYRISSIGLDYGYDPESDLIYATITLEVEEYGQEPFM